jgi:ferredoxin/flavodoxin
MILYLYFSGTGNTKYVIDSFSKQYKKDSYIIHSIEDKSVDFTHLMANADEIFIAFPIYGSMMPFIMEDFFHTYKDSFANKVISTIVTQLLFSGDGGALPYYLLKHVPIQKGHSIHIKMPNNASDVSFLKTKSIKDSYKKIQKTDQTISKIIKNINNGKTYKHGRKFYSWALGFFIQRLYATPYLKSLRSKITVNMDTCIHCNKCVEVCPTSNLSTQNNQIITSNTCTLCYRCINTCPVSAISLLGKHGPKTRFIHDTYN